MAYNITATSMTTLQSVIFNNKTNLTTEHLEDDVRNEEDALIHIEKTQSPAFFYSVLSTFFVFGIFSNSLLVMIFILQKSMRTIPNCYIFNLALADLFTVISCAVGPFLQGPGKTLSVFCKGFQLLLGSCMGVISLSLISLSVERYYAIAKPFQKRMSSRRLTISVAILTWVASVTYTVERMVMLHREESNICVIMFDPRSYAHIYTLIDFLALYLCPLVIITIFYVLLAKELYFSDRFVSKDPNTGSTIPKHMKVRKKIAVTVLVLVFMFAVFYFPFNFLSLLFYLDVGFVKDWSNTVNVIFCVGCLHGCINPLVLYSLSESFRGHFNNYLFYSIFKTPIVVKNEHTSCHCVECSRKLSHVKVGSSAV